MADIFKVLGKVQLANLETIYKNMKLSTIKSPFAQAGILAVCAKESGLTVIAEFAWNKNSVKDVRGFPFITPTSDIKDKQLEDLKNDPKQFFDYIYGGVGGNSAEEQKFPALKDNFPKNKSAWFPKSEGYKFKGRGFNQITFKGLYSVLAKQSKVDIVTNPDDILKSSEVAAKVLIAFYEVNYRDQSGIRKAWNISGDINTVTNLQDAVGIAYHVTAGVGLSRAKAVAAVPAGWAKANDYVGQFYDWIMKKEGQQPDPDANKPSQTLTNNQQTANQTGTSQSQTSTAQTGESTPGREVQSTPASNSQDSGNGIKNIVQTKVFPREIRFPLPPQKDQQNEILLNFGKIPVIYYNSYQIKQTDVDFLSLNTSTGVPTLTIRFKDTYNLMKDRAMPMDDTKIAIFINTLSEQLYPIHIDFKITRFNVSGSTYNITGMLDVSGLYLKNFKSIQKKTSFQALKTIAEELGIGFSSNIDDTDDSMTWINPGERLLQFIQTIVDNSYKSDEAYLLSYIDYYYNLTYVEIEKELKRDIKQELGIANIGLGQIAKVTDKEKVSRLFLTNDQSMRDSNSYFNTYRLINNSTSISLEEGYLTKVKFYDQLQKEFLIFDVDSITSEGESSIILKGSPQDDQFFKQNVNLVYNGKIDMDNMHKNYNYSTIQNSRNVVDLQKVGLEITMVHPNYNLIKYQKVHVLLSNNHSTPAASHINNRLTGEWLIVDISYKFEGKSFDQVIKLVKRELDLSPEELGREGTTKKATEEPGKNYDNNNPLPASPNQNLNQTANDQVVGSQSSTLPIITESGDMAAVKVPAAPTSLTKSSPSGYPIKEGSFVPTVRKNVNQIMLHYSAGWQLDDKCAGTTKFVSFDRGLSYHYVISVDGHIENLVDPRYSAQHGANANANAIGISLECLGTTFGTQTLKYGDQQIDYWKKRSNAYRMCEYHVNLVDFNGNPRIFKGQSISQEVSDKQLNALRSLLRELKNKFPLIPSWTGLTEESFKILFSNTANYKFGVPGLYTHGQESQGKSDIAPTPKIVSFLKSLRY